MVAQRYEFYLRVAKAISHELAQHLVFASQHKIPIFEPMCNVLFVI